MKKLFLLLILPAILGAQPKEHYYNATFLSGTVSNFIVPEIEHKYPNLYGIVNDTIERLTSTKTIKKLSTQQEIYKNLQNS